MEIEIGSRPEHRCGPISRDRIASAPSRDTDADCAPPPCTPILTLSKLRFHWLGQACYAAEPQVVTFAINVQQVARVPLANGCTCTPGVASVEIADPALLVYGKDGVNVFRATTTGTLSWATVEYETPEVGGESTIWAAWPFETLGRCHVSPRGSLRCWVAGCPRYFRLGDEPRWRRELQLGRVDSH